MRCPIDLAASFFMARVPGFGVATLAQNDERRRIRGLVVLNCLPWRFNRWDFRLLNAVDRQNAVRCMRTLTFERMKRLKSFRSGTEFRHNCQRIIGEGTKNKRTVRLHSPQLYRLFGAIASGKIV